jgi:hypothetical protein
MKQLFFSLLALCALSAQSYLDAYTNYNEMTSELSKLGVKQKTLAKTAQGRNVTLVQFGDDHAPAIFVLGNIDGDYYVGTELAMRLVRDLKSGKINRNGKTIYIVPMPNPDAVVEGFKNPQYANSFNSTSSDDDHDQLSNEDGFNDLNGDGVISQMRVKSVNGEYKTDSTYSNFLMKIDRLKGETGDYLLFTEGKDDDGDDKRDEDGFGGTNINQNFTYNYNYFGKGSGLNQVSEPETKAIADFVFDHPNILITVAFSKYDNLHKTWNVNKKPTAELKRPLRSFETILQGDKDSYTLLAETWKGLNKGWKVDAKNVGDGTFHEWSYYHTGRWGIAVNGWNYTQIKLDTTFKKQDKMSAEEKLFHDASAKQLKHAVIPWKAMAHPDFPNEHVEIGGFHTSYMNNPASDVFASTKSSEFIEELTTFFPKIEVLEASSKKLGDDLHRITVRLRNVGALATQGDMGKMSQWMYPVRIVWDIKKEDAISGTKKTLLEPIAGFGGEVELSWLIKSSKSKLSAELVSPVVGSQKINVNLEN